MVEATGSSVLDSPDEREPSDDRTLETDGAQD